jgi:hypothetical protein
MRILIDTCIFIQPFLRLKIEVWRSLFEGVALQCNLRDKYSCSCFQEVIMISRIGDLDKAS